MTGSCRSACGALGAAARRCVTRRRRRGALCSTVIRAADAASRLSRVHHSRVLLSSCALLCAAVHCYESEPVRRTLWRTGVGAIVHRFIGVNVNAPRRPVTADRGVVDGPEAARAAVVQLIYDGQTLLAEVRGTVAALRQRMCAAIALHLCPCVGALPKAELASLLCLCDVNDFEAARYARTRGSPSAVWLWLLH